MRFRCLNPKCLGRTPDPIYANERGYGVTVMGRVLVPGKRMLGFGLPQEVQCDVCKIISRTRICPACHFELSYDIGQVDQRIIAIIGGRATGKTHYIASLITRLQHEVGKNFDLTVRMLGDNTQERWERDFYAPLFIRKTVLQPTRPAEIDSQVKAPLIFRLTFKSGGYQRALNLSFFDSAGEDMTSLTTMSIQNRYICYADAIIFLLDPLQIPSVRHLLPNANVLPSDPKASPENIVGRLRDLFEHEYKLHATQKVKTLIAFTLSKVDTLVPLLEPGSELQRPSQHFGYLDLDDVQSVSTEIANYLASWINPTFCEIINDNFADYSFFGVSSLGAQPDVNNRLSTISPLRVEDPFLWILHKMDLIKGKKRR
jgi:hypothetical protein